MKILRIEKCPDHLLLLTSEGRMKLEPFGPSIVRIVYTLNDHFSTSPSLIVLPESKCATEWEVLETDREVIFSTKVLSISVDRKTGRFTYRDSSGDLLAREPERGGKTLATTDVIKNIFDNSVKVVAKSGVDGIRANAEQYEQRVDRQAYHTKLEFVWADDEALYGLGSHEEGMMNLRGQHQYLYQQNMKAVVPVMMSTKGYGILVDSCSLMAFHDDAFGSYIWCDVEDEMDYYFMQGVGFDDIIRCYRNLTGRVPMLPRWAFGYVQSKEAYCSQEELISIVREYRERRIPMDLLVQDWRSWTGDLFGQKSFDPERFPDPDSMMDELHSMNARLMISMWPNMRAGGSNNQEMMDQGYMLGNQMTYDAFQKGARELYWKQTNEGLFRHGLDAWWCDCSEPFEADWKGEVKPEPEERMLINTGEAKKYMDPEYISAYSLLHSQGIYEGQRSETDKKRVVNLTRSSYAGQHRYSTISWSGDIAANWDTYRKQIPSGLNFCVTGEPWWTLDIGAFFVGGKSKWVRWCSDPNIPAPWFLAGDYDGGCDDLGYRELYVRWFQYGAFLPMFRAHGTDTPREVWRFGEPGSVFYDTLVKFINLRYRLMPYIYSMAGMVTHQDYTMMRALAFDFSNDSNVFGIADQYMFGPAIMVCPVTSAMYYERESTKLQGIAKTRSVYLPSGCDWYDFWTGESYDGGQRIEAEAQLETMPLYVRAGSILPMGPLVQHTGEGLDEPMELRVYPGANGSFTIYEDEGDNYNYEKGAYAFTSIHWDNIAKEITFGQRAGSYAGQATPKLFHVVFVSQGRGVGLEARAEPDKCVKYIGEKMSVDVSSL